MTRHTKIVATLGPASSSAEVLERMVAAGVDVVRMNFSHGTAEDHKARARTIREIGARLGRSVGILGDLQGPKIRVGKFENNKITLATGDKFILDAACKTGNQERVGLDYKELPKDVKNGDILLLDDGRLKLTVNFVKGTEIHTTVLVGGDLSNNKGINRQGGGLTAPALTAKDMDDIKTAAQIGVDFVAVSFPKSAADMYMARQLLRAAGRLAVLIAKIERVEAVDNMAEILDASDGVMVARGDLAVECGYERLAELQEEILWLAEAAHLPVTWATQVLEGLAKNGKPSRAEITDAAMGERAECVMLNKGPHIIEAIRTLDDILQRMQGHQQKKSALLRRLHW